jgi:secreted Zn-dependent insulinase-like peptidase
MVCLWKEVLKEYLNEFAYMGECAELSFSLSVKSDSLEITWNGYNDSMPAFVSGLMTQMQEMRETDLEHTFTQVKEKQLLEYKNFYLQATYRLCTSQLSEVITTGAP